MSEPRRVLVVGALGRMGERVRVAVSDETRLRLGAALEVTGHPRLGETLEDGVTVGDDAPPPPDKILSNFFDEIVLELPLTLDAGAPSGDHQLDATVTYYYCLKGEFCSRKKVDVTIPISIR